MGKGRGKRSVLAQKAQTIEEIWESVSRTKSADLNPPPSKIVLTPRSAEACLRHGLNPEILRIRPLDSFDVKGVDPTVQRLRHETYTQRRFEMMRLVRAERKRLVAQEARDADLAASGAGGGATITPQQLIAAQAKQNATFIEEEEKRMRKMSVTQRGNSWKTQRQGDASRADGVEGVQGPSRVDVRTQASAPRQGARADDGL